MIMAMAMAEHPKPRARPGFLIRVAAALLFVAGAGWLSFAVSVAGFARAKNPALAAAYAPFDAVAAGERAYALLESNDSPAFLCSKLIYKSLSYIFSPQLEKVSA